ncbi:MAG TPA: serine hydrolase [Bacteroidales bacterium]|nr:serine hydrolase [Bacteroidales bacterium]
MKYSILLLMFFSVLSCLKEEEFKKPFVSYEPKDLHDGWDISTPEAEGLNGEKLTGIYEDFHNRKDTWQVRSLLVFRNGKLLAESYTKDDHDITNPILVQSCTKQVISLLTGIAIEHGLFNSVTDSIKRYIPEVNLHKDKTGITIQHLLTMKSGIDFQNEGMKGNNFVLLQQKPSSLLEYILDLPMADKPGTKAMYKDCDAHLMAICIQKQAGQKTSDWAREVLFDPLAIKYLKWDCYRDGYTLGGHGIFTTPRELGKFGQLVLDSGSYKGQQIVSREWIREMTQVREQNVYGTQFGYFWRLDARRNWVMMMGHGGQLVCIVPEKTLIVVIIAEPLIQGEYQLSFSYNFGVVEHIISICN